MRVERLAIPAFGPFTEFEFNFPAAGSDFQLIYGPNEAGKSSLLRAIRDLLYGIHGQTPDNFLHDYKDLRLAGTVFNAAGQRLSFQRRKGNKNTLLDEAGNPLPDEALAPYLGVVDRNFFTTVFGLGSEELRQGAEALLHGRGELGQALFSASLAGTPIHRTLASLDQEARTLFDGRARVKVSIRPSVDAYEDLRRRSKSAVVRPEIWEESLRGLAEIKSAQEALDEELKHCGTRRGWLQRCLDALPMIGQLDEQERRLAALPATPGLSAEFVEVAERSMAERAEAQGVLHDLTQVIEQLEDRVAGNQPNEEVLAREGDIVRSYEQLALYRKSKNDLGGLTAALRQVETELRAGMRGLAFAGEFEALDALRVPAAVELAVGETAIRLDESAESLRKLDEEAAGVCEELDEIAIKLLALPTADVSALRAAMSQTAGAGEAAKALSQRQAALSVAYRKAEVQRKLLGGAPKDHKATFDLPVPRAAALRQFATEAGTIDVAQAKAVTAMAEAVGNLKRVRGQLMRLERRGDLPSLVDLSNARKRRDDAWVRVAAACKGEGDAGELDGYPLVDAYPFTVRAADEIADRLREEAEVVTQAEELRCQLHELESNRVAAQSDLKQVENEREAWEARWKSAWSACGISPGSPEEMLEWRDQWAEFRTRFEAWENANEELAATGADIVAAEALLSPLLSAAGSQGLLALRDEGERRIQAAIEATGAQSTLNERQRELRSKVGQFAAKRPELSGSRQRAANAWATRCKDLGLPVDISTEAGVALLERRLRLVEKFDEWTKRKLELESVEQTIGGYESLVRELADALELPMGTVEVQENALSSALTDARSKKDRQTQAQADLEPERARQARAKQVLAQVTGRVTNCVAQSQVADEEALKILIGTMKTRHAVEAELLRLRDGLHGPARGEPLDTFVQRVRAEKADSLIAEREALDRTEKMLKADRDRALQDLAAAERAKQALEQSGAESSECLQAARNTAVRIRHDASRFLRLRFAIQFLREQIDAYRKQNQAPMLARAGDLFRAMTGNSFDGLGTTFGDDDTPLLVGVRAGSEIGVLGMSEGTRDQLYLALRLAAIEHHQAGHEPMPVILDDLLVTFDDHRARALLPILHRLGTKSQVMLFTHHRHLLELAREALCGDGPHIHEL